MRRRSVCRGSVEIANQFAEFIKKQLPNQKFFIVPNDIDLSKKKEILKKGVIIILKHNISEREWDYFWSMYPDKYNNINNIHKEIVIKLNQADIKTDNYLNNFLLLKIFEATHIGVETGAQLGMDIAFKKAGEHLSSMCPKKID